MPLAGLIRFTGPEVWGPWFEAWGYPAWFMLLVCGIELVGAILLWFRRPNWLRPPTP